MRVGIVGAGLQARRRAPVLREYPGVDLVVISAAQREHAVPLANQMRCEAEEGWECVVRRSDLDVVLVCAPPHIHADVTIAALEAGKHVLCEKPLARTDTEAKAMVDAARRSGKFLKCGFNHRHHPGMQQVRRWVDDGVLGELMFIRGRYGICGRLGYEAEWRANPEIVAGGQLMEHGIHVLDLFRWFLGEPDQVAAMVATNFWNVRPLEDNAFVLIHWPRGQTASLHSSLTQWRNLFSFEVFGRDGYAAVEGLGGGYGVERAILGRRDFSAPFAEHVAEYRGVDLSWREEWHEFSEAIRLGREPLGNAIDGLRALQMVNAAYVAARDGQTYHLPT